MNKVLFLLLLVSCSVMAYTPSEDAKMSILTATPGDAIYKVYGHTAIRFRDQKQGRDIVYNYGMFNFSAPHFMWRYLRGQNEYLLGRESYKRFYSRYVREQQGVTEQILNLTPTEVANLYTALEHNAKAENRNYLYNVFYDNCATRVYKIIENQLPGGVIWKEECEDLSFRDLMHQSNHVMPFSQMGIDMVFGLKADKIVPCMDQMFLPIKLKESFDLARKSDLTPLVSSSEIVLENKSESSHKELIIFYVLFTILVLLSIYARRSQALFKKVYQITFYLLVGLTSFVVFFIDFFSIHPTILPNLNLIWINPIWLILAIVLITKKEFGDKIQKLLNIWCYAMALLAVLSLLGVFYLHIGAVYMIFILITLSYKRLN